MSSRTRAGRRSFVAWKQHPLSFEFRSKYAVGCICVSSKVSANVDYLMMLQVIKIAWNFESKWYLIFQCCFLFIFNAAILAFHLSPRIFIWTHSFFEYALERHLSLRLELLLLLPYSLMRDFMATNNLHFDARMSLHFDCQSDY
jgi:hypothetical protein